MVNAVNPLIGGVVLAGDKEWGVVTGGRYYNVSHL
jgi:hypothetical protein